MTTNYKIISEKEYNDLVKNSKILKALYYNGVDNWDDYELALDSLEDTDESYEDIYGEEK